MTNSRMTSSNRVAQNLEQVRETMTLACQRAGRKPDSVTLVAVSKTHPADLVLQAIEAGQQHFGENRIEEASEKIPIVNGVTSVHPVWHNIGHIQSRKTKLMPGFFQVIHSIDSVKLAERLSVACMEMQKSLDVMLEINVSGEESKAGFDAIHWQNDSHVTASLVESVTDIASLPGLNVCGLMTMAPYYDEPEATRPVFASLAKLRDVLRRSSGVALPDLSMGMTNDYAVAIEEGATIIRVGRAIFGERDYA